VGTVVLAARIVLAGVFAVAAFAKLVDLEGSRRAIAGFGVPARAAAVAGTLLPFVELATATALIAEPTARWGAIVALALLLAFMAGIARAMALGQKPDCHCFGQLHSAPAGRATLIRNAILAVPAAIVVIDGPGPSVGSWISARTDTELVAVGVGAVAAGLAALALWQWREIRTLRGDLTLAQADVAALPPGLPIGAWAPKFELRDLHGEQRSLEALCARGRPVVLLFLSPDCSSCRALLPEVGRWQAMLGDRLTVAVITSGASRDDLGMEQHGLADVLVQEDSEVMRAYRVESTPCAVAVTPQRTIASTPAEGPVAIEPLIRLTLRRGTSGRAPIEVVRHQPAA
jgi:thiol-disulfide isomerase/thioredoxin/uncharacterized membrane protein YphA (DoxX/SURF4 family)